MEEKEFKFLVIDADIVSAAGETSAPTSIVCRTFLETVLNTCHHCVITSELAREWNDHTSNFSSGWRFNMESRDKVEEVINYNIPNLRSEIDSYVMNGSVSRQVLEDVHLIEAALKADKIIISMNDQDRKRFARMSKTIETLRDIAWLNPLLNIPSCVDWLEQGAEPLEEHKLGYK